MLGVPVRLPLTINLDVDAVAAAAAEEEEQQQQEKEDAPLLSFDGVSIGAGGRFCLAVHAFVPVAKLIPPSTPLGSVLNAVPSMALNTTGWSAGLRRDGDGIARGVEASSGPTPFGADKPVGQIRVASDLRSELLVGSVDVMPPAVFVDALRAKVPSLKHVTIHRDVITASVRMMTSVNSGADELASTMTVRLHLRRR